MLHYVLGRSFKLEILLYVDDWLFIAVGTRASFTIVFALLFLRLLWYPFSPKKHRGGMETHYIGYYMDWVTFGMGISEHRALWIKAYVDKL